MRRCINVLWPLGCLLTCAVVESTFSHVVAHFTISDLIGPAAGIGGAVCLILVVIVIICIRKKHRNKVKDTDSDSQKVSARYGNRQSEGM